MDYKVATMRYVNNEIGNKRLEKKFIMYMLDEKSTRSQPFFRYWFLFLN